MKCPVCKSSVESFNNICNTCGLPFPGSEWFFNSNDFNSWRKSVQNASIEYSERDNESDDYTCIRIINSSSIKMSAKRDGSAANAPYPISLSLSEAANGTVTSLYIYEPNKTGKTMAIFHLPPNILSGQILTMKSGTTVFYLIVNITDFQKSAVNSNTQNIGINKINKKEKTKKRSSAKKQDNNAGSVNANYFVYAKNYPILYTSKRIKGSGKTKDDPYAVTVSVNEAKNGTTKTISIIDSATGDRIPAELEIPAGVQNGRLLKMESSNRKQTLYVAVYIENIPEKVFLGYLLGCLGFSIATTAWSFVLVSKKAFWIFIIIILIVLAVIIRKKAKRS